MRKLFFLLILLIPMFAFASDYNFVSYFSNDAMSHACISGDALCRYNNVISIPSEFAPTPTLTEKVLGISGKTNAHVEINTKSNYSYDLNLKKGVISSGICEFTSPGSNCSVTKNCIFGISGEENAHLSKCDVFNNEIKFCCDFSATIVNPGIQDSKCGVTSFEINKNLPINVKLTCENQTDLNLFIFDNLGSVLNLDPIKIDCNLSGVDANLVGINFIENRVYLFRLVSGNCFSEKFGTVEKELGGFAIPDYNIFSIVISLMLVLIIIVKVKDDE